MKVYVKKIINNRLVKPTICDKCDTVVYWDAQIDYEDEFDFYITEEQHYYCTDHLLELAQSRIKNELIEL